MGTSGRVLRKLRETAASYTTLPRNLAERIPARVQVVTLLAALVAVPASAQTLSWPSAPRILLLLFGIAAAMALASYLGVRLTRRSSVASIVGAVFIVVYTLIASFIDNYAPQPEGAVPTGHAAALVTGLVYVVVVPTTPRNAAVLIGVVGAGGALTELATPAFGGQSADWLRVRHHLLMTVPYMIGTYFIARTIHDLGRAAERAGELGSYRLLEPIGSGGMGEVWRAEHRFFARPAAVKRIHPERFGASDPESIARLLRRLEREAHVTAHLTSPHTVEVYDFGRDDEGAFYFVMELLDGVDLQTLVARHGPLEPERAIHLVLQACASLAEAHDVGLVHRDIKPANLIVCRRGMTFDFLKVLDFGLVKDLSATADDAALTDERAIAGTPGYLAPEVAVAQVVDARVDVYALGCVLFWLLTGSMVFESEQPIDLMIRHARDAPEAPSARAEHRVPAELDAIVLCCLEKSPKERFASVQALGQALEGLTLRAWSPSRAQKWWTLHEPEHVRRREASDGG